MLGGVPTAAVGRFEASLSEYKSVLFELLYINTQFLRNSCIGRRGTLCAATHIAITILLLRLAFVRATLVFGQPALRIRLHLQIGAFRYFRLALALLLGWLEELLLFVSLFNFKNISNRLRYL